jgi:diacylglycerol kinase family enzyme
MGEDTLSDTLGGPRASAIPQLFGEHYNLAIRSMTEEHAAATAHDAVQRHLASVREAGGDGM